jgi:hypothetical protein
MRFRFTKKMGRLHVFALALAVPLIAFQNCGSFTSLTTTSPPTAAVTVSPNGSGSVVTIAPFIPNVLSFSSSLINAVHRYDTNLMFGGWGAQLGHLLRSASNGLWFVDDNGNDVNVNAGLGYYRYLNGAWVNVASQTFPGVVQQNTGSVISDNMIFSYGVDVQNNHIIECYFDTSNADYSYHACNALAFDTGADSNYIGATISKSGSKVVWWTNTTGTFSYIYNFGGGWNGPITSPLPGYTDFSYVYARLNSDNSHIDFLGASAHQLGGASGGYDAIYASTTLGTEISNWELLYANGTGLETWIDPSGGAHFLTYGSATPEYFYKPAGGVLTNEPPLPDSGIVGARIIETSTTANLVMSFADGTVTYKTIRLTDINGAINWSSLSSQNIALPPGLGVISMYPESAMYQTNPPQELDFAINGYNNQGLVYYIQGQ